MRIPVFLLAGVAAFAAAAQSFYTEPTYSQVERAISAAKGEEYKPPAGPHLHSKPTFGQFERLITAVRESGASGAAAAETNAARIAALEADVQTNAVQIAEISGVVGTNSWKIAGLEADVAANASAIAALGGAMAGIVDESGSIPFAVIEKPLAGETMPTAPTQNELAEAVKKIFTALGGTITP